MKRIPTDELTGTSKDGRHIRALSFQAVTFWEQKEQRQVIMLYALGEDGIVREYRGTEQAWLPLPIRDMNK